MTLVQIRRPVIQDITIQNIFDTGIATQHIEVTWI